MSPTFLRAAAVDFDLAAVCKLKYSGADPMNQTGIAAPTTDFDDIRGRLRELVDCLADGDAAHDEASERILMDVEVDGRRYLLVKMAAQARNSLGLSPREIEIVRLVAEGHPNKVIAAVLDISAWTVCTHVRRVFMKLGVTSRAAMVARSAELMRKAKEPLPLPHLQRSPSPLPGGRQRKAPALTRHDGEKIDARDVTFIGPRDSLPGRLRR